ncbi:DUF2628 domain-containing protein [Streptococcus chenjunshii]|uniref:DUF2628 domain-containing protein n=1 Tax=Streptococcus chenjunshii TaxID=2173853 RepID=A0A372KJ24_9STRE|nr:DUF2628 domain-containing protein [Streptococcus chenjunshii]AXQ79393.1 DUF2628 domain-containing protein [Streptococcus chenjunshii]RFU50088.1 DUF2628 domain-containing protein [Streptococcus chenjunshii]RFU52250.1 DUF2628 domain-containing protein [Streptococcus chenjunshii]
MKVTLKNKENEEKKVPIGISWTTFFFGPFVPLFRRDWKWFGIMLGVTFVVAAIFIALDIETGGGVVGVAFSFIYNRLYCQDLLKKGWQPATEEDTQLINEKVN